MNSLAFILLVLMTVQQYTCASVVRKYAPAAASAPDVKLQVSEIVKSPVSQPLSGRCGGFQRNVSHFAFYHISKCGGSTINHILRDGGLTKAGREAFLGEAENSCHRSQCEKPAHAFIMTSIRNPFSFYASYWQMILNSPNPYEYGCIGSQASRLGLFDIFDKKNGNNRTTFVRFLRFFLLQLPEVEPRISCDNSMSGIYRRLLLGKGGEENFDAIVTLEDYWPSLERTLQQVECLIPGSIDFEFVKRRRAERPKGDGWNEEGGYNVPYHCFFSENGDARRLVEQHDKVIMARHGYTFEQFVASSRGSCEHVVD
jgi:hypothetical protein